MLDHYYAVIMAGGGGTRLWPLSRQKRPKQMLNLFEGRTLFQASVQRLYGVFPPKRVFVVTIEEQARTLQAQSPEIPKENFLIEPSPRGTASVVGMAAAALHARDPQAIMAVVTADHYIENEDLYSHVLETTYRVAQDGYLVTLGVEPSYPATGFGYIRLGEPVGEYGGFQVQQVERFIEKPALQKATEMVADGRHVWNSGMFFWKAENILTEFERQMPELSAGLKRIEAAWPTYDRYEVVNQVWDGLHSESIDYGIMEHAQQEVVVRAPGLGWNDVGTWESLFDVLEGDQEGNIIMGGDHIGLDTHHTLVYMQEEKRLIVTIGVKDLVLVDTGDVLLVCNRQDSQRVRQIVNQLKERGKNYL
jgi:mannose-1-phosphate guanylyltransferase